MCCSSLASSVSVSRQCCENKEKEEADKTEVSQGLLHFILPFSLVSYRPRIPPLALIKILAHIILTVGSS